MKITWLEMKKALLSPMVLTLIVLMLGWNIYTIVSESDGKEELNVVIDIIQTYGPTFNDETLALMEQDIVQKMEQLGFTSTQQFLEQMTPEFYEKRNPEDQALINEIYLWLAYYHYAEVLEGRYANFRFHELEESFKRTHQIPTWLANWYAKQFDAWEERFTEIVSTEEYKQWFFLPEYKMHQKLFSNVIRTVALEALLVVTLMTALIVNFEFENRTQFVTYSTKRGRKLLNNKVAASLIAGVLAIFLLFGVTLGVYFFLYDYTAIWPIDISSGFNWEYNIPYISWWEMPYWLYFTIVLAIIGVILVLALLIMITIAIFIKNSYFAWLLCIICFLAMMGVPLFFKEGATLWFMHYNILLLLLGVEGYFYGGNTFTMERYYEVYSLLLWVFMVTISSLLAIRYFKLKDVT